MLFLDDLWSSHKPKTLPRARVRDVSKSQFKRLGLPFPSRALSWQRAEELGQAPGKGRACCFPSPAGVLSLSFPLIPSLLATHPFPSLFHFSLLSCVSEKHKPATMKYLKCQFQVFREIRIKKKQQSWEPVTVQRCLHKRCKKQSSKALQTDLTCSPPSSVSYC